MRHLCGALALIGVGAIGYWAYNDLKVVPVTEGNESDDEAALYISSLGEWIPQLPIHPKSDITTGTYSSTFVKPGRKNGMVPARNVDYVNASQTLYASTGPSSLSTTRDRGDFNEFTKEGALQ